MMKELKPLTISNSVKSAPSVLLTPEMEKFVFVQPLTQEFILAQTIYTLIHKHFKIELLEAGIFKLKGVKYLCAAEPEGVLTLDEWQDYLWNAKRSFNHLLNPDSLFRMYLVHLFFPVFSNSRKMILPGKKDRFVMDAYPILEKGKGLHFEAVDFNKLKLSNIAFRRLFSYLHQDLFHVFDEFMVLHHDNLYKDLKYQVSLYPTIRNQYWNELKKCFDKNHITFAKAEVENYLLKL